VRRGRTFVEQRNMDSEVGSCRRVRKSESGLRKGRWRANQTLIKYDKRFLLKGVATFMDEEIETG
jgi:hypothetical protein